MICEGINGFSKFIPSICECVYEVIIPISYVCKVDDSVKCPWTVSCICYISFFLCIWGGYGILIPISSIYEDAYGGFTYILSVCKGVYRVLHS